MHRRVPWPSFEAVEFDALKWVESFNRRRPLEPIDNKRRAATVESLLRV
jgi:hypothetical protein